MESLDAFISNIAAMLLSLLEGELDIEILQKMSFSLQMPDIKDRILNVFGMFLQQLNLFPKYIIEKGDDDEDSQPLLAKLSEKHGGNVLANVSINKINNKMTTEVFEGCV